LNPQSRLKNLLGTSRRAGFSEVTSENLRRFLSEAVRDASHTLSIMFCRTRVNCAPHHLATDHDAQQSMACGVMIAATEI
jgi:hypothetical protein